MRTEVGLPAREYHDALWEEVPEGAEPPYLGPRLRFLLERLHAGERVLDVGCGEGRFAAELADRGIEIVGMDIAAVPLRRAHAQRPDLDLRVLEREDRWPLQDGSFDAVWAGEVLEHVADTAGWFSELRRVLRSDGRVLLSTPAHDRLTLLGAALSRRRYAERFDPCGEHLRFYSRATLTDLLRDFGFEDVRVRGLGGLPAARATLLASARRSRPSGPSRAAPASKRCGR